MSGLSIEVSIITPEQRVFEGKADYLVVTAYDGEMAILPGHAPIVVTLGIGPLRVEKGKETTRLAVRKGFIEFGNNCANVLVTEALKPEDIELSDVERDLAELAAPAVLNDADFAGALEGRAWAQTRMKVAGTPAV